MEIGDKVYATFEYHQTGHDKFGSEFRKIDGMEIIAKVFIPASSAPRGEDYFLYTLENDMQIASFFCTNKPFMEKVNE